MIPVIVLTTLATLVVVLLTAAAIVKDGESLAMGLMKGAVVALGYALILFGVAYG